MDPTPGRWGPFWTPITPEAGSLFHAVQQVINAYIVDGALQVTSTRHYVITEMSGPDNDGNVTFEAADVLNLAKNEKAVAPKTSNGVLLADITDSDTFFTLSPEFIGDSEYPSSGRALVGSEIISYTRYGDSIYVTGRGVAGTTAASHSENDTFQQVLHIENMRADDAIRMLLVDYAGIDPAFIPWADWQTEISRWMGTTLLNTHIVKPTGVSTLVGELAVLGLSIWWDDADQNIGLKANRPAWFDTIWDVTDRANIKEIDQEDQDDKRLTQVLFYSVQADPTKSSTSAENFNRLMATVDLEAEQDYQYGESAIKRIYCRWLDGGNDGAVRTASRRLLKRFRTAPRLYTMTLDAKDRGIGLTDVLRVATGVSTDETGAQETKLMEVIQRSEPTPGHEIQIVAQAFQFDGKYGAIAPNGTPSYAAATDQQKADYAFISANQSPWFPDNSEPYEII